MATPTVKSENKENTYVVLTAGTYNLNTQILREYAKILKYENKNDERTVQAIAYYNCAKALAKTNCQTTLAECDEKIKAHLKYPENVYNTVEYETYAAHLLEEMIKHKLIPNQKEFDEVVNRCIGHLKKFVSTIND